MNTVVQFLNKSLFLSICLHLIGVSIASLSIVGTTDKHGDSIVAEFIFLPKTKPVLAPRQLKRVIPEPTQSHLLHHQPPRIQTIATVAQVPQTDARFLVTTAPVDTAHTTASSETGNALNILHTGLTMHRTPLNSEPTKFELQRIPRPELTSPGATASFEVAELPAVPMLLNEPTQNARFFHKVEPIYPDSARLSHKQGVVFLEATIGVDGKARNIKVIKVIEVSGLGCEQAAIKALKASQFVPAMRGKVAVSQRLRIPYRFQFKN